MLCWFGKARCTVGKANFAIQQANALVPTRWTRPDWSSKQKAATTTKARSHGLQLTLTDNRKTELCAFKSFSRLPSKPVMRRKA